MQRRWIRRVSPKALMVALTTVTMVLAAFAVSQADPGSHSALAVSTMSGGPSAALPAADSALASVADPAPESPPTTDGSTTTTTAATERAAAVAAPVATRPCPRTAGPVRPCRPPCDPAACCSASKPCPPPCPPSGSATSTRACPPPCAQPASPSTVGSAAPSQPSCPPPCSGAPQTDSSCPSPCTAGSTPDAQTDRACPQPCPAYATADGKPAPCPQPCPQYATADGRPACPPPCAYPTEPDGGIGSTPPAQAMPAYACPPPCAYSDAPAGNPSTSSGSTVYACPPPCSGAGNAGSPCPPPCNSTDPAPATTTAGPVPPSRACPPPPCESPKACPPPCPSAAPTDRPCTPPCSYPGADGTAGAAFAPCPAPSGVEGRVTAGPTCPVQRADQPCADRPVETTLRLLRKDGSVAATGKSAADGTFRIAATPGAYRLVADWPSRVGGCAPVDVTVEQGRFAHADVSCDTGIR